MHMDQASGFLPASGKRCNGRPSLLFSCSSRSLTPPAEDRDDTVQRPQPSGSLLKDIIDRDVNVPRAPTAALPAHTVPPQQQHHHHDRHHQPIPPTCFPNRSNSVFPVLSKYRIFLESSTPLRCSNSSRAYLFISSRVGGGRSRQARTIVR